MHVAEHKRVSPHQDVLPNRVLHDAWSGTGVSTSLKANPKMKDLLSGTHHWAPMVVGMAFLERMVADERGEGEVDGDEEVVAVLTELRVVTEASILSCRLEIQTVLDRMLHFCVSTCTQQRK